MVNRLIYAITCKSCAEKLSILQIELLFQRYIGYLSEDYSNFYCYFLCFVIGECIIVLCCYLCKREQ